jgi:hypothetical protein
VKALRCSWIGILLEPFQVFVTNGDFFRFPGARQ